MKDMKRNLFFVVALMGFAACSDKVTDAPFVVSPPAPEPQDIPILFGSSSGSITRYEFYGADAAAKLDRKFVVSGYKGDATASFGSIVYDNFFVEWTENTANTTESNTTNWEYVGKPLIKHARDNGVTQQSVKYWDYTKPQYDFIAWSSGHVTPIFDRSPEAGEVRVSAITPSSATGANGVAYTFEGRAADLHDCYIADLVTVKKASYGNPVVIRFRSLGTKVRIGLYETIPGYSVKDVKFYSAANSDDAQASVPRLFTTSRNEIYTQGKYIVYYPTVDSEGNADNNQAHVRFDPADGAQSSVVDFSALNYTSREDGEKTGGDVFLGRTSKTASLAAYTQYIPNETGTNLNLRVDYTLESIDGTGETLVVRGATAQVPSIYTRWKAGYAYTYLFKITDQTNGHTGTYDPTDPDNPIVNPDPAGLYPITFAAVVVNDEDNTQENITLVSTPSITTYQEGSNMLNCNEYSAGRNIYVTVSDSNTDNTPDLANGALQSLDGKVALYTIPAGKTEAEVVDAFQIPDDENEDNADVWVGRNGIVLEKVNLELTNTIEYGADGNFISVGANQAAKFTPSAGKTYAFVYTKTPFTEITDKYEVVTKTPYSDVTGLYRNFNLTPASGLAQTGTIYFRMDAEGKLFQAYPVVDQDSVDGLYVYQSTPSEKHACMEGEKAVSGHSYFDKYYQNNGVYYAKVIKVQ